MEPDDDLKGRVDALRKAGRYAEAANLCLQAGEPRRASELYAAVWDWPNAIAVAEENDLYALAYAHALAGEDRQALARLMRLLPEHPDQALEAAAAAERKGRIVDAARLREAAGEVQEAAQLYARAGELFEAARCEESAGRYREAGMLYERRVKEDPTDGEAALRLGRILAHFGRFDHAARALQTAEKDPERSHPALELLVACFDALGMDQAAGACLDRLREEDPALPVRVPDFLEKTFGNRKGLAGLAAGEEAAQLLAGRYRVVRPLGAGATGRVLLAHDGFYDREVAVKVLSVGTGAAGRDAYTRFAREARVAAGLEHPNVVHVHEFNPDGPFLVMEYMAGGTLADRLEEHEGPLPLAVVQHVAASILRGLEAVHRRGVIHRDLKPANVFFGATGDVKIGDFGVAHLQDLGATLTGALLGTLAYMAPEQITGSQRPEAGTDLYAFGCILYQLLTGALPFPGPDFVTQQLEATAEPISRRRPRFGPRFDPLLERLLAKPLEERPQGVDEVRRLLAELDWTDPDENALERLVEEQRAKPSEAEADADARPSSAPRPSSVPAAPDRYAMEQPLEGGAYRAHDTLLARAVRIEPCDAERASWLKHYAQADGPFLQAIFDLEPEAERAILEDPAGEPLTRAALTDAQRDRAREQIRSALETLHGKGLSHGEVRMGRVRVATGRAVLLLPTQPPSTGPEDDLAALDALFP